MKIEKYERYLMIATLSFIVIAVVALILSMARYHVSLPTAAGRIDPNAIDQTAPFNSPGLHARADGEYDLVLIAQAWAWTPTDVHIPKDAKVHILATSRDVQHGLRIPGTNVNAMVLPGLITKVDVTFDEVNTFTLLCHEYCGIGHQTMGTHIIVE
jgi:cytochrome c oxidase subunit II